MPKISKGRNAVKFDEINSKVNQVIYYLTPISTPNFKALAQILFEISCLQGKMPKEFLRAITHKNLFKFVQKLMR